MIKLFLSLSLSEKILTVLECSLTFVFSTLLAFILFCVVVGGIEKYYDN